MERGVRVVLIVVVLAALAGFGLREVGFRSGPSTRDVSVHTAGPGGTSDFVAAEASESPALDAVDTASRRECKAPDGFVNRLFDVRGPKAVFVTEIIPSGETFRFRWDCRLSVLRLADQ